MVRFIWKFLYIGTISHLLIPVAAYPQFNTDFDLPALGDLSTQQASTSLIPAPDDLPDDAQRSSQTQNADLLAQPQSLDVAFDPSLIALSPPDTQIADAKSIPNSASCSADVNLKPGASRLLRRAYGEMHPCCDPVNLGLQGPLGWIFGRNTVEERFPYCCEGPGFEYTPEALCAPWSKDNPMCANPDSWSCCIYGGAIYNGKVYARHCWSIYPPPLKVPQRVNQQH